MSATLQSFVGSIELKVVSYSSALTSQSSTVQTPRRQIHVPIRTVQPTFEMTYQWASIEERRRIVEYVRRYHVAAKSGRPGFVRILYPYADLDLTGIIKSVKNSHSARTYSGKDTMEFELVKSMVITRRADFSTSDPLQDFFKDEVYNSTEDTDFDTPSSFIPPQDFGRNIPLR